MANGEIRVEDGVFGAWRLDERGHLFGGMHVEDTGDVTSRQPRLVLVRSTSPAQRKYMLAQLETQGYIVERFTRSHARRMPSPERRWKTALAALLVLPLALPRKTADILARAIGRGSRMYLVQPTGNPPPADPPGITRFEPRR